MELIAGFLVALMLGFWMVGARNRLVRLRQGVAQAFPALEMQLRKRHALARHLAEASLVAGSVARPEAEAVKAAAQQASAAADAAHPRPAQPAPIRQLAAAEEVLAASLPPLLPAVPPDNGDTDPPVRADPLDPTIAELQARLAQIHAPLDYARQAYNAAVQVYNAALRVFPTTVVATMFRFEAAAMLPRLSRPAAG